MELEVLRACAAGIADATIGLNAMIDALVLDKVGDARPSHVRFFNYADDAWVARKALNAEEAANSKITPCVIIYLEAPATLEAEVQTIYRDGEFPVAFSYLSIEPDDAKKMRDALYINRALLRFLSRFNANANAAMRFRNNVNLFVASALVQYTPFEPWGELTLAASTIVTYRVREHLP